MYTKKIKKAIFIYCEGDSEKNYFEALKGNKHISENYVLKPNSNENDLNNAITKFERLGIDSMTIYVYDSDTFELGQKKITEKIEKYKEQIYFSEEDFEDFLRCHKTNPSYRDKKPKLSRYLVEELRNLDYDYVKHLKKPNQKNRCHSNPQPL